MKKNVFILFFLLAAKPLLAQVFAIPDPGNSNYSLTFTVSETDTTINIQPNITLKKKIDFQIKKVNIFEQKGAGIFNDGSLFLQKLTLNTYVNLTIVKFIHYSYDINDSTKRTLSIGNNYLESFKLNEIYPIEKGNYRLRIEIDCSINKKKRKLSSNWVNFESLKNYPYPW